jgi:hypothetical protein
LAVRCPCPHCDETGSTNHPSREVRFAIFDGKTAKWWTRDDVIFVEAIPRCDRHPRLFDHDGKQALGQLLDLAAMQAAIAIWGCDIAMF